VLSVFGHYSDLMEKLNHYFDVIEDRFAGHPDRPSTVLLKALQLDASGDWAQAHELVQTLEDDLHAAAVHAYLHRKEGDEFNARYWYQRAGRHALKGPITEEWVALVTELLELGGEFIEGQELRTGS
jgi:hypothetical protein